MRRLLIEQVASALRKLQDSDTLFHVRLICRFVLPDRIQKAVLFRAPLARLAVKECNLDPSIQLVFVQRFDPIQHPLVIGLQSGNSLFVVSPFVGLAFAEGGRNPLDDLLVQGQLAKPPREFRLKPFLSEVRLLALPLEAGAVIVDVLLLFDLPNERAATVTAVEESGVREAVLSLFATSCQTPIERSLNVVPELARHKRFMGSLKNASSPVELAGVDPIPEHLMDRRRVHYVARAIA